MSVEQVAAGVCAWLASYLAHSTIMLGAAWLVTRRLPSRFDRLSELAWRLALGLPVLTAILQQLAPLSSHPLTVKSLEYVPPAMSVSVVPSFVWLTIAGAWVAGAAIGIGQLAFLHRSLRGAIAHRIPLSPAHSAALRMNDRQDPRTNPTSRKSRNVRLSVVDDLLVPLALSNEVCLPAWVVDGMGIDERRAVVAHELAHVRRRDAIWRPCGALVTRLFFFQPLNWVANVRLCELSECICDEEAIVTTEAALPLASALEAVAARNAGRSRELLLVPAMQASRSFTLERVTRILSSGGLQAPGSSRLLPAFTLAFAIAGVALAPRIKLPPIAFQRYTITAADPAGEFTLTVEKGQVVSGTIEGRRLDRAQVSQRGRVVRIARTDGGAFDLHLTPDGGIRWNARKPGN